MEEDKKDRQFDFDVYGTMNEEKRELWIRNKLSEIPAGATILDAGAGDQRHKKDCAHLNYVSQDIAKYDGKGDGTGLQTGTYDFGKLDIVSDITSIPREDGSFDAILCSEVLEHIPFPELAIKEFARLLKTNGTLILTAPFSSLTHFAPYHFATGYNHFWYKVALPKYGFKIKTIDAYGDYFEYMAQEIRRVPFIAESMCMDGSTTEEDKEALNNALKVLAKLGSQKNLSHHLLCFGFLLTAEKMFE